MSAFISGIGWVTPLGNGLDEVWQRLMAGQRAEVKEIVSPDGARSHFYIPVPPKQVEMMGRTPRLRRSSAISYFTAAAGLAALENAGLTLTPELAARTAVILAVSSGGVVYSRRFYETIVAKGANAASPLLFPETVFNAPASHVAALLGVDGASYTVVGDASAGVSALQQAEQILETGEADYCLVIGAEEVDWILCEAYREWRLTSTRATSAPYQKHPPGMLLGEGAAALLLQREGSIRIGPVHGGVPIFRQKETTAAAKTVFEKLAESGAPDLVVGSANGTFIDAAEAAAISASSPGAPVTCPKTAWGDAIGASALLQTAVAAMSLLKQQAPPAAECAEPAGTHLLREPLAGEPIRRVAVPVIGLNQHAAGLVLSL